MGKRKAYVVEVFGSGYEVRGPDRELVAESFQYGAMSAGWMADRLNAAHDLAIKLERQRQRARARRAKGRR